MCALDNGCAITEFAETDFCGDNIFFEDLPCGGLACHVASESLFGSLPFHIHGK
jgi:hypothetical protein